MIEISFCSSLVTMRTPMSGASLHLPNNKSTTGENDVHVNVESTNNSLGESPPHNEIISTRELFNSMRARMTVKSYKTSLIIYTA